MGSLLLLLLRRRAGQPVLSLSLSAFYGRSPLLPLHPPSGRGRPCLPSLASPPPSESNRPFARLPRPSSSSSSGLWWKRGDSGEARQRASERSYVRAQKRLPGCCCRCSCCGRSKGKSKRWPTDRGGSFWQRQQLNERFQLPPPPPPSRLPSRRRCRSRWRRPPS